MRYYKIIINNEIVGIGTTIDLRKFQKKHEIFLSCDESEAQYIQYKEKMYHAVWMLPVATEEFLVADVVEIQQDEYETLLSAMESNETIEIVPDDEADNDDYVDENDKITIDYVKKSKINEMKATCNKMITNGFDIKLSDGESHHFSLTIQDQLNLITSSQMILDGIQTIPYHADGELCKYYSITDMDQVVSMANSFKTYHVAYFNSLKSYINSLQDINKISAISYGDDIPVKYQSEVYIALKYEF